MPDDRPAWAIRIRAARCARGWSLADAARELRRIADKPMDQANLVRNWKRWETGEVEPDRVHKPLLAKVFGTVTAALFPRQTSHDAELLSSTGLDTLEVITRLRSSDVSQATIEALQITAERLGCEYSRVPAGDLYVEGRDWLQRLTELRDRKMTLAQHREILALAGQIALLVGCVEYDLGLEQPAETTRRGALLLGQEAGDSNTVGWAHEMRAWFALTHGQYRAAIAAADAGLAAVGPAHSVVVQMQAHRAKAWARMGNRAEVDAALESGRTVLEALPYPDNPDNHFVVDPSKWDFYTMDAYRHVGEDRLAEEYAREVLRTSTDRNGVDLRPMRAAEARVTLGVVAARQNDLEGALMYGRRALGGNRQSLPSLTMCARELGAELVHRYPDEPEANLYLDELRALTAA